MTWRSRTTGPDRAWASLVYLYPLTYFVFLGGGLLRNVPFLIPLYRVLIPVAQLNTGLTGIAIFIALILLVVQNDKIAHFIRFNAFQALLLWMGVTLVNVVFSFFTTAGIGGFSALVALVIHPTLALGVLVASGYAIVQNIRGLYPEIPYISDVVYSRLR